MVLIVRQQSKTIVNIATAGADNGFLKNDLSKRQS